MKFKDRSYLNMLGKGAIGLLAIVILLLCKLFDIGGERSRVERTQTREFWIRGMLTDIIYLDSSKYCKIYSKYFMNQNCQNFNSEFKKKVSIDIHDIDPDAYIGFIGDKDTLFNYFCFRNLNYIFIVKEKDSLIYDFASNELDSVSIKK